MKSILGKRSKPEDEEAVQQYVESLGAQKVLKILNESQAPKSSYRVQIESFLDKFDYNIKSVLYQINTKQDGLKSELLEA